MPDVREEFEAWYSDEYYEGDRQCAEQWLARDPASDRYLYGHPVETWRIWQASRAALLNDHVPMPRQCPSWLEDAYDDAFQEDKRFIDGLSLPAYEAMLKAQEEALQQAGIEVMK